MSRQLLIRCFKRWSFRRPRFKGRKSVYLVLPLVVSVLMLGPIYWWCAKESSGALLPPPVKLSLHHYRINRSLQYYMRDVQVLIEPSSSSCRGLKKLPVVILVSSSLFRFDQRQAVRETWAKYQPTFFVIGLYEGLVDQQLVDTFIESKQYKDLLVFDFLDQYQNLTLKTVLMMKWTLDRCPQAQFMFKTDDDVMVNPWTLRKVLKEHANAQLIGYSKNDTRVHRDGYNTWYTPRWLLREDKVPKYLSGTGYLIRSDVIEKILKKAHQVPMINLEDVYYTYLVAHKQLGLTLTHDRRLSPYKPWLKIACVYWGMASVHSVAPEEMTTAWSKIEDLVNGNNDTNVCWFFNAIFN